LLQPRRRQVAIAVEHALAYGNRVSQEQVADEKLYLEKKSAAHLILRGNHRRESAPSAPSPRGVALPRHHGLAPRGNRHARSFRPAANPQSKPAPRSHLVKVNCAAIPAVFSNRTLRARARALTGAQPEIGPLSQLATAASRPRRSRDLPSNFRQAPSRPSSRRNSNVAAIARRRRRSALSRTKLRHLEAASRNAHSQRLFYAEMFFDSDSRFRAPRRRSPLIVATFVRRIQPPLNKDVE